MGRPAKFTTNQLQAVALGIVDTQGLEALSMRSLARELGTAPMTLYNYVAVREDLDMLVIDAVLSQVHLSHQDTNHWTEEVRALARSAWTVLREHPNVVPLVLTRRSRSPAMMRFSEALLSALAKSGRQNTELLYAFRAVTSLIAGVAQGDLAGPLAIRFGESKDETIARFRALPIDQFPHLVNIAGIAASSSAQADFEGALDILLMGLAPHRGTSKMPSESNVRRRRIDRDS